MDARGLRAGDQRPDEPAGDVVNGELYRALGQDAVGDLDGAGGGVRVSLEILTGGQRGGHHSLAKCVLLAKSVDRNQAIPIAPSSKPNQNPAAPRSPANPSVMPAQNPIPQRQISEYNIGTRVSLIPRRAPNATVPRQVKNSTAASMTRRITATPAAGVIPSKVSDIGPARTSNPDR